MKRIIVVEGFLAGGKSTFVRRLSSEVNVPYFIKDTFKIALCESVPITNRADGSKFSAVTFDGMMYVTERMMEVGLPLIIEGNFVPPGMKPVDESAVIRALVEKYGYKSLTFKFKGDLRALYARYTERNDTAERGDANRDFEEVPFETFERYCNNLSAFGIGGEVITVDTSDFGAVDFEGHIEAARAFLRG